MREIIFRGKRVDNGKWVYGNLFKKEDFGVYMINCFEVIAETIGQYTGLKDMNKTKIFEGDIVAGADYEEEDGYGVVTWFDGAFWVGNNHVCGTFCNNYYENEFEVKGNIHNIPELLKGNK